MRRLYLTIITLFTIVCVIGGTLTHAIGFAVKASNVFGKELFQEGSEGDMTRNYEGGGSIRKMELDVEVANVTIKKGASFAVSFTGNKDLEPEVEWEDDELKVEQKGGMKMTRSLGLAGGLNRKNEVMITVPEGETLDSMEVEMDYGNCRISDVTVKDSEIRLKAGNIEVNDAGFEKFEADADAGNIEMHGCKIAKGQVRADMGNIKMTGIDGISDLVCDADLGNIQAELAQPASELTIVLNTDLGNVHLNGEKRSGHQTVGDGKARFEAKADLGNVEVKTGN
ncbi:MAG: DUF4097 family beta strand repeat protein [Lachnospiraceae bacterium]|nr:DUF4097 family beta strand repeat protein [Lachnospiraceae bacterium]